MSDTSRITCEMKISRISEIANIARKTKLKVMPLAAGNMSSNLCLIQNQASLTSWHSVIIIFVIIKVLPKFS